MSISLDIPWYGKNWFVFGKTPQLRHTIYGICHSFNGAKFYGNLQLTIPLRKEDIESSNSNITNYTLQKIFDGKLNQITQKPTNYLHTLKEQSHGEERSIDNLPF
ncbi:hypothetical protein ACQ3VF_22470 [Bacillus toyonensis]|uniref:hypothetical protein n=1 Tax=Bacillus toyonensis TaxID=155322 RepID=UPI003D303DA9